ncbi:MAG TPA: hypothetical protein VMZ71_13585, partial [Gemmataceae bacterium]|nr:hypothetical protein [Gemmataceae bacterium]
MDFNQLRSWLGLPPGAWPPDHYAILGLTPGPCDPAAVESIVLDRMDHLRPHQLRHPELVTEGMNRLAQALVCLTDAAAKAEYDVRFASATPSLQPLPTVARQDTPRPAYVVVAEPLFDDEVFSDDEANVPPPDPAEMTQIIEMDFESGLQPPAYTVVEWEDSPESPAVVPYEVVPDADVQTKPEVVEAEALDIPNQLPVSRRWIYARLALVRKALRVWDKLRPVLADPKDPLDRPGRVLALLDAAVEVRPLFGKLKGIVGGVGEPGAIVAAVVSQRLILDTVRTLLPSQRQAVAIDWRRGMTELQQEYARLRGMSRAGRDSPRGRPAGLALGRWIA